MGLSQPPTQRFWRKVRVAYNGCWLWAGAKDPRGYGSFQMKVGDKWRTQKVHRLAYEWLIGPIPDGLELDHLCRVPSCINPAHLEPVTHKVNVLRGQSPQAKNARKARCPQGHEYTRITRPGGRRCRICDSAARRLCWANRRLAA